MLYETLKLLHILFAIVAVGGNISYGYWIGTSSTNPQTLPHVLRRVRDYDRYLANPCYGLLLLSGAALVWIGNFGWDTWILAALGLWVLALGIGTALFLPTLKKQIDALDRHGLQSQTYQALAKRSTMFGLLNMVPVAAILILMVFKPALV